MAGLQRTISDISHEFSNANIHINITNQSAAAATATQLPPISDVEEAKCECCGMSEECTPEYIQRVRSKFSGKLICGLCAEAVDEEMEKINNDGGQKAPQPTEKRREAALQAHMSACVRFNRLGRSYPALYQADAVRKILKKSTGTVDKAKSTSRSEVSGARKQRKGGLARTSSCLVNFNF